MCNMASSTTGQGDLTWTRASGATPDLGTGPDRAVAGDYYLYLEATGRNQSDTARYVGRHSK